MTVECCKCHRFVYAWYITRDREVVCGACFDRLKEERDGSTRDKKESG